MDAHQKVLFVDAATGYYRISRFLVGDFFDPADLGLYLSGRHNSLNIGAGLLAGSIFPGSNRLIFTGFSPCWGGFFISSMGGAGLVFDNPGLNMVSLIGRAPTPSLLYLNRTHGEEIDVRLIPLDLPHIWGTGRGGIYALMDHAVEQCGGSFTRPIPASWPWVLRHRQPTSARSGRSRSRAASSPTWTPGPAAGGWAARCSSSTGSPP